MTEFTPHQRDVFCVFSGNMVSKFRDFLNTSPQFDELRENYSPRGGLARLPNRRAASGSNRRPATDGEGQDDDMADDNDDFEGLDGSEMVVDVQAQNPVDGANGNGQAQGQPQPAQAIPVPPPVPIPGQIPISAPITLHARLLDPTFLPSLPLASPLFQSILSNTQIAGVSQRQTSASSASLSHGPGTLAAAFANGEPAAPGASTAPMHQRMDDEEDTQPNGVN